MPMSIAAPTPTKPAPTPPAIVNDLNESSAATWTDCCEPAARTVFTDVPVLMNADVVAFRSVTLTGTPMPTKPPPIATTRPKKFSLERAWTARPWKVVWPKLVPFGLLPSETPPSARDLRGREVDAVVRADPGLRVLRHGGDLDADADADEAAGRAAGDRDELRVVARRDQAVVARADRDEAAGGRVRRDVHDEARRPRPRRRRHRRRA